MFSRFRAGLETCSRLRNVAACDVRASASFHPRSAAVSRVGPRSERVPRGRYCAFSCNGRIAGPHLLLGHTDIFRHIYTDVAMAVRRRVFCNIPHEYGTSVNMKIIIPMSSEVLTTVNINIMIAGM